MLTINKLEASIKGTPILKGLNLQVNAGEVHAIMGPNGSGKSTLAHVLAGHPDYDVTAGSAHFKQKDLLPMTADMRARSGIFLAFQYPVSIPGVNNTYFLKEAVNQVRKEQGKPTLDAIEFMALVKQKLQAVGMDERFLKRSVNDGFSGGEKKRNEMLQMLLLEPDLAILDETDSGLDIDALQAVAQGINQLRSADRAIVMVTHYQRLLNYIEPDFVHVLHDGKIIKSGDKTLAHELESQGYGWLIDRKEGDHA